MATVPRASRSQIFSGSPLMMAPRRPQTNKSSHMVISSVQMPKGVTVGRSQAQLTGSSLQMSKPTSKPAASFQSMTRTIPRENRPLSIVRGTPLQKFNNTLPRVEPSQMVLTRYSKPRISTEASGISFPLSRNICEPNKTAQTSMRLSKIIAVPNVPCHSPNKSVSQVSGMSSHATTPSQMVLTSVRPRQTKPHSQAASTFVPNLNTPSQLTGASLHMSTTGSQASKSPSVVVTDKETSKTMCRIRIPCRLVDGPPRQTSTRQAGIPTTTRMLIMPANMRTVSTQFRGQKPIIATSPQLFTGASRSNRHELFAGKSLQMSA